MPFPNPGLTSLKSQALAYLSSQLGYTPLDNSPEAIIATMTAFLVDAQNSYLNYCFENSIPFTSSAPYLDSWGSLVDIFRNPAVSAIGTVNFTGTSGAVIPAGTVLIGSNSFNYATNTQYVIGSSSAVGITAVVPGGASNGPAGMSLALQTPLVGVQGTTTAATAITGGADTEGDASLRSRMLLAFQAPASGGSASDFKGWALASSAAVTRAWIIGNYYPGVGSVTVFFMEDGNAFGGFPQGNPGVAAADTRAVAATGDMLTVANYIYDLQPVNSLVWVEAPQQQNITVQISGLGFTNTWTAGTWSSTATTTENSILAALQDILLIEGTALGGSIPASALYSAVNSVQAVSSFTLVTPVSAITTPIGYLPVINSLVLTA